MSKTVMVNKTSEELISVVVKHQKQDNWCWAAVAEAVDHYYKPGAASTQCSIAAAQDGAGNCCVDGSTDTCDRPWFLEKALFTVNRLEEGPIAGTLDFEDIKSRFSAKSKTKPICARIGWKGSGGHFVAIKGLQDGATPMLWIADPIDGDCLVPYDIFVHSYHGFGSWTDHYLTDEVNHVDHI
jgi:papain like cysteine protease AvrRpt2